MVMESNDLNPIDQEKQHFSGNPRNMDENTFHESPEEDETATSYGTNERNYPGQPGGEHRDDDQKEDDSKRDLDQDDLNDDFTHNSFDRDAFDTE